METFSALLALYEGNPLVTPQKASKEENVSFDDIMYNRNSAGEF